jgi:ADP-ribosylation factor-like protein 2
MGLMTILRKVKMKEREMRVLMLGLDNAGKTTVVKQLKGEDVRSVSPTLGFDICTMTHGEYTLNIWDVGGQQTIRAYWRNYFEATDAIVWVVDSADVVRMAACRVELETVLNEERLAGASLLVLANKQDLAGALDAGAIASLLGLDTDAIGRKRHWLVVPCSAVTSAADLPCSAVTSAADLPCSAVTSAADQAGGIAQCPAIDTNGDGAQHPSNLEAGFDWLIDDVSSRIFLYD